MARNKGFTEFSNVGCTAGRALCCKAGLLCTSESKIDLADDIMSDLAATLTQQLAGRPLQHSISTHGRQHTQRSMFVSTQQCRGWN
jgi:hypothetical protein